MAVGAKLIGHPERIVSGDREAEVVVSLGARPIIGRDRDRQAAPDQAQQLTAKVGHHRAAVAGIQGSLHLDQPTKLSRPELQGAVKPRDVSPPDRMAEAERITDDDDLVSQRGSLGRDLDRPNDAGARFATGSGRFPGRRRPTARCDGAPRHRGPRSVPVP